jgi:hypothetical protein
MVNLSDYLGTLFSEITRARVEADLTSYHIAQQYRQDEILKHFPVPHIRFKSIDITLPVVMTGVDEKSLSEYMKPLDPDVVRKRVADSVTAVMKRNKVTLAKKEIMPVLTSDRINLFVKKNGPTLRTGSRPAMLTSLDTRKLSDEYSTEAVEVLRASQGTKMEKEAYMRIRNELKEEIDKRLTQLKPPPPVMDVIVNTAKVKEAADKDTITYLTFTVFEEAFEWADYESDGVEKSKLIRE